MYANQLNQNHCGNELQNNKSRVIDNSINKSLENGIKIYGSVKKIPVDNDDGAYDFGGGVANAAKEKDIVAFQCTPQIWRNKVRNSTSNGILVVGKGAEPDIRGNVILQSRRAGIKLTQKATAYIGGTKKSDLKKMPLLKENPGEATLFADKEDNLMI